MTNSISAPEGFGHLKMATHKLLAAIPSSPHLLAPSQLFPLSQTMPLCTIFAFSCGSHSRSHPGQAPPPPPAEVWGSPATPAPTPQAQPAGAGRVSAAAGMWWDPRHFRRWWDPRHRRRQQPPSPCHPTHGGHGVPPRTAAIPLLQSRDVPAVSVTLGQAGIVLFQPGVLNSLKLAPTPLLHSCAGGSSPGASLPSQGGGVLAVSSSQNALGATWPWHPKMPQGAGWDGCPQRLLGLAVPTVPPPPVPPLCPFGPQTPSRTLGKSQPGAEKGERCSKHTKHLSLNS